MITIDRDHLQPDGVPDAELLRLLLDAYATLRERLHRLHDTYEQEHRINSRQRLKGLPNNRLVHDLPGYIVAMSSGYLVGEPVSYTAPEGQEAAWALVTDALKAACSDSVDAELAVDAAVYGKGVELCYADEQAQPRTAQLDPRSAFVVYDDTVEHSPLFGVVVRPKTNRMLERVGEHVTVYTDAQIIHHQRIGRETPQETGRERHFFGRVPMVEYWNNAREKGDFESVMTLIDAYDVLESDRVNDKQQFTDAIMVLKGVGALDAADTVETRSQQQDAEDGEDGEGALEEATDEQKAALTPSMRLRQTKMLFLPADGSDAAFVTKPDAESGNEVLRCALKADIHKLSFVPDLTDEQFAGNVSGVAMKFKLFGLEQLTKAKERWFREGLRNRLRLFAHFLTLRGAAAVDADQVQIGFTRSLPVNELEIAQTVATYSDLVPREMLLSQVPFVEDAQAAMEMLKREQDEALERQQQAFELRAFREDGEVGDPGEGAAGELDERDKEREATKESGKGKKRPGQGKARHEAK